MKKHEPEMYVDNDCLIRLIYGMNDVLSGFCHADFQVRLRDALQDEGTARRDFLDADYSILSGAMDMMSGAVEIIATGLMRGDIDLNIKDDERG